MKKFHKFFTIVLAFALVLQLSAPAFAINSDSSETVAEPTQIENNSLNTTKTIAQHGDTLFYMYASPELTYCAQVSAQGYIQFSYIEQSSNTIVESETYSIEKIYSDFNVSAHTENTDYDILNGLVLENINTFNNVKNISSVSNAANTPSLETSSPARSATSSYPIPELDDMIEAYLGENYTGKLLDYTTKTYGGQSYYPACWENKIAGYADPERLQAEAGTYISTIIAWMISKKIPADTILEQICLEVFTNYMEEGIYRILLSVEINLAIVTLSRTRIVNVNGGQTRYYAGWDQKHHFLKGDLGWAYINRPVTESKSNDYDDIDLLMEKGWQNYINTVLMG